MLHRGREQGRVCRIGGSHSLCKTYISVTEDQYCRYMTLGMLCAGAFENLENLTFDTKINQSKIVEDQVFGIKENIVCFLMNENPP